MAEQRPGSSGLVSDEVLPAAVEEMRDRPKDGPVLSFHNICYSVTVKKKRKKTEKEILKNIR